MYANNNNYLMYLLLNNSEPMAKWEPKPKTYRPILGSNRLISRPSNQAIRQRVDSRSNTSDADDSSFRSSFNYSSPVWPKSIQMDSNSNQIFNTNEFFSEDSCDSKSEFEANGRDVPLDPNTYVKPLMSTTPFNKYAKQYELFGKNGFKYAIAKPIGDKREDFGGTAIRNKNRRRVKSQTFCSFCKNNNETPEMYNSHVVKDLDGITRCPVLRLYDCPKCRSGGGDNGHTIRYCPLNRPGVDDYIPSVIKQLKNSRSADGKKRGVN